VLFEPSRSSRHLNGVGLLFVGRAIGSGWQGPLQFQGMGAAPPQQKKLSANIRPGRAGRSKPRHRNGPFDWVAIHSLIERQVKADRGVGPWHPLQHSRYDRDPLPCVLGKIPASRRKRTIGTGWPQSAASVPRTLGFVPLASLLQLSAILSQVALSASLVARCNIEGESPHFVEGTYSPAVIGSFIAMYIQDLAESCYSQS
jgi:hypothetical protein